jgi:predicted secreted protein
MLRDLCRALPLALLALSAPALAGDAAELELLGFSADGRYLAFEQYGILDGSGTPYAEIFFIDVPANAYAAKPVKSDVQPDVSLDKARESTRQAAADDLKKLKIDPKQRGQHLIAHGLHDLGVAPREVEFTPQLPLGGMAYESYRLHLESRAIEQDCFGLGQAQIFTLALHLPDGKTVRTLQHDGKLPESRGCPLEYRIQDVYLYKERRLAVFLNVFQPGYEGRNMRYLVVTSELPEQEKEKEKPEDVRQP